MNCSIESCTRAVLARGLCRAHYLRAWRHGSPVAGAKARCDHREWFERHVAHAEDDCLIWPFQRRRNGYGTTRVTGKHSSASRVMCELAHGAPESPAMQAAHNCGNGHLGCVNPRHLRWATRLENSQDAKKHGTTSRGRKHSDAIKRGFAKKYEEKLSARIGCDVTTLTNEARKEAA